LGVEEVSPSENLVGFVGRLVYQKDPLLFLDVMEQLPEYGGVMIGGGDLEDRVQADIEGRRILNLQYLGPKDHAEVIEILPTFSVLLMTSRWEGLPILPLEAMELGVPVVATNVGGISEIIKDGENGVLIDGRSPGEIANAVRSVLTNEEYRLRLIKNGKHRIQETFSEERMLKEINKHYKSIGVG
jgi:glycosyltransferase involved in cell wall biosynthesis